MQRRSKLEQVLEHLVHEEQDKAQELLHQFIVERARSIHEELMSDEDEVLEDDDFSPEEAESEIESQEMFDGEDLGDEEGDEDAMDDMEMGDEEATDDVEAEGDEGLEDKISELESELEELRKEFEELQGDGEEGEEDFGGEDDEDMEMDGEGEDELDVDMEMDDEGEGEEDDELKEVEDYTTPKHNANRKHKGTAEYGQNKGKPMSTDVHETEEGDQGNVNRVKNAGYKKADPMKTDVEDADGPSGTHEFDDGYAYKQAGWPGKAMSTESVDLDEEWDIFDSLDESVLDDLETVNVKMGGEQGGGKYAGNETHTDSPIPQKEPAQRFRNDKNSRLSSEQDTHQGFEREGAPKHENVPKYSNVRDKSSSKLDHKEKAGDKSAMLNSDDGYGEPQTTSPIGSKGTAGNKGVRGSKE